MGLGQAKKKVKLSHDPNNTNWTKNTTSFGHKILAAQGWTPGEFLGPKDAAHAEFHSAANASHIRVVLKDDNLGLGAKKGSGQGPGECTGLDAFASLLGRLNADDQDAYVQEEKRRDDLKKAIYTEQKWGSMRFVKGGFLVGDKVVEIAEAEAERVRNLGKSDSVTSETSQEDEDAAREAEKKKRRKEKKLRKQAEDAEIAPEKVRSKKEKKNGAVEESPCTEETKAERKLRRKEKKEKKRKAEEASSTTEKRKAEDDPDSSKSKKRRKSESPPDESTAEKASRNRKDKKSKKSRKASSDDETPEPATNNTPKSNPAGPTILQGRHAVRARNIAQKRLASMDAAAVNQIFMFKG